MASTTNRLMTFAEFERMPDSRGRHELRHGELVEVPPPAHKHVLIQIRLRRLLESTSHGMGEINTERGFRALPEYEYRVADVAFIARERWARIPPDGYLEGAPDLVIEVLPPSNSAAEVAENAQSYTSPASTFRFFSAVLSRSTKSFRTDHCAISW